MNSRSSVGNRTAVQIDIKRFLMPARLRVASVLAVGGFAIVALAPAVPVFAQSPGVIRACVQQSSLQVRIIGAADSCKVSESLVTWNAQGVQGPAGPAGPAGTADLSGYAKLAGGNAFTGGQTVANGGMSIELGTWAGVASFSPSNAAVFGRGTAPTGWNPGVQGETSSSGSNGVYGVARPENGVFGPAGNGVVGDSQATVGYASGVSGFALNTPGGVGVQGGGKATGVVGVGSGTTGVDGVDLVVGVNGWTNATTGLTFGVNGFVNSPDGFGLHGSNLADGGIAIRGLANQWRSPEEGGPRDTLNAVAIDAIATGDGSVGLQAKGGGINNLNGRVGAAATFQNFQGGDLIRGQGLGGAFRVASDGRFFAPSFNPGGADFAEVVEVAGARDAYEAGDLMVIDATGDRRLMRTDTPYSTMVAGIYSTKPGILASPDGLAGVGSEASIPLAILGIVPVKVTAENGAIARGDRLVSSSLAGYAMKGTDRSRMLGAVVGKALQPLASGTGIILVLVTLQ